MHAEATDLARIQGLLREYDDEYRDLVSQVVRGDASMAELARLEERLRELRVLAAAIEGRNPDANGRGVR